jgi:fido (protein-threonine AMPylation protein)
VNKFDVRDPKALEGLEQDATKMRDTQLRMNPQAAPTRSFDIAHAQELNAHYLKDVYSFAGKLRGTELGGATARAQVLGDSKLIAAFEGLREVAVQGVDRQKLIGAAASALVAFHEAKPFLRGNEVVAQAMANQAANAAGYDIDFGRDPSRWNQVYENMDKPGARRGDAKASFESLVDESTRSLRVVLFERGLQSGYRAPALDHYPELGTAFKVIDEGRGSRAGQVSQREARAIGKHLERALGSDNNPQKAWEETLRRSVERDRSAAR